MREHGLLEASGESQNIYIEYGAGRAGLSSFVADDIDTKSAKNHTFVIVDRDTRRRKLDKTFREDFTTYREKMDIADFDV